MKSIIPFLQVFSSVSLIAGILLQRSEASLGTAFGGEGMFGGRFTRRGLEKIIFNATGVLAVLFTLSALAGLILGE